MPETPTGSSPIDRLSPTAARSVLALAVLAVVVLVAISLGLTEPARRPGPSDFDTYERVVTALRGGQDYYPALHDALLAGGYGTLSPLNWRTPLFLTLVSWFPSLVAAQMFLGLMTLGAWGLGVAFAYRRGGLAAAIAAAIVLAASLFAIVADRAALSFELCAGTLILLSVAAYGLGWRRAGFAAAALALFVRELAAVYVLVCVVMALRQRQWREATSWAAVLVVYAGFYLWHWSALAALIGPQDHAATAGWLQFGGLVFVLRTAQFNGVLLAAPYWVGAIVLVAGLLGLAAVPRALATVALYLLLFLAYGRPENNYWGALYAPLVALGLVWAPAMLQQFIARSRRSSAGAPAGEPRSGS